MQYLSEQKVRANGIDISYDSFGQPGDPVIILIMGLATQKIFWDTDLCNQLAAEGFRVIRFDNRDIGQSTCLSHHKAPGTLALVFNVLFRKKLKSSYLLDDMAKDTLAMMDALAISQAHIVGASMGGMIAQIMAITAPERVLSLTSIMSTTGNRVLPRASNGTLLKLLGKPANDVSQYVKQGTMVWRLLHADHYPFDDKKVAGLLALAWQRGVNVAGVGRQLAAILASADRTASLAQLTMPVLVIHGEKDPLLPVACGLATAQAIPGAKLKLYPGMGHTIPQEIQQDVVDEIIQLIQAAGDLYRESA